MMMNAMKKQFCLVAASRFRLNAVGCQGQQQLPFSFSSLFTINNNKDGGNILNSIFNVNNESNGNGNGNAKGGDPFKLVEKDLNDVISAVRGEVHSDNPLLEKAANYYFKKQGKLLRPTIILLMAQATNEARRLPFPSQQQQQQQQHTQKQEGNNNNNININNNNNNIIIINTIDVDNDGFALASLRQKNLAPITEMIHIASLLHDDVLDVADTRRSIPTVNSAFGNKLAVLAGDFMLARASVWLARLRSHAATTAISTSIANLVEGEVMQMKATPEDSLSFDYYMRKTYLKTAALMAESCRAVASLAADNDDVVDVDNVNILNYNNNFISAHLNNSNDINIENNNNNPNNSNNGNSNNNNNTVAGNNQNKLKALDYYTNDQIVNIAYEYGKHLGLAFQIIDDMLDYNGDVSILGKPLFSDLKQGLATAPVLFAMAKYPELSKLITRKFSGGSDVNDAIAYVNKTDSLKDTYDLAVTHAKRAAEIINLLPPSPSREALKQLAVIVISRKK